MGSTAVVPLVVQALAAACALVRATVQPYLPRLLARAGIAAPLPSPEQRKAAWGLAAVLLLDAAGEWLTRAANAALPSPAGEPLQGLPRLLAWSGLAVYAAWLCSVLGFVVALAARPERRAVPVAAACALWLGVSLAFGAGYPGLRGEHALRVLGALHCVVFLGSLPAFYAFTRSRGEVPLGTERIAAVWLACLSVSAGIGPLAPWLVGPIDHEAAATWTAAANLTLDVAIIATMGASCFLKTRTLSRLRSRLSPSTSLRQ